jgi:small subunit ribosomal protein S16
VGGRKDPVWRVVVADQRSPRDGRVIETIGHYNAQTHPSTVVIDESRARTWIARGAQPSKAVQKLLKIRAAAAEQEARAASAEPEEKASLAEPSEPSPQPDASAGAGVPEADVAEANGVEAEAPEAQGAEGEGAGA